jgi:hypothetical protein
MDKCNQCSDEQLKEIGEGLRPSLSELLDELADLVAGLDPERQKKLMEELESGELRGEGGGDNAEES